MLGLNNIKFLNGVFVFQIIGEYMEASADMHVFSPVFKIPPLEFYIIKHFTELQNRLQMNFTVSQHGYKDVSVI